MNQSKTRSVVESGLLTALMSIFAIIGLTVPLLSFFGSILVPTTVAVVGVRHGLKWSLLSVLSAIVVIGLVVGPMTAFIEGAVFGSVGMLIGYGLRHRWAVSKLLIGPAVLLMGAVVFQVWSYATVMNLDVSNILVTMQDQVEASMREIYLSQGLGEADIDANMSLLAQQVDIMKKIIVGGLFCSGVAISYLINRLAYVVLQRVGTYHIPSIPTITGWYIPDWALHIFLVGLIFNFTHTYVPILEYPGYNLMYLGGIMLFIRGIAMAWRVTKSYRPPKALPWIVLAVFIMMSQSGAILGALDVVFHFEERWKRKDV